MKLVGMHRSMAFQEGRMALEEVGALWRAFRPRVGTIPSRRGDDFISMRIYEDPLVGAPGPEACFEQWAAVEVSDFDGDVEGMERHVLRGGLYAVFIHHGPARAFGEMARFIYGRWLPASGYELDDREHFEVLGPWYRPDDAEATEDVWIPIRPV